MFELKLLEELGFELVAPLDFYFEGTATRVWLLVKLYFVTLWPGFVTEAPLGLRQRDCAPSSSHTPMKGSILGAFPESCDFELLRFVKLWLALGLSHLRRCVALFLLLGRFMRLGCL